MTGTKPVSLCDYVAVDFTRMSAEPKRAELEQKWPFILRYATACELGLRHAIGGDCGTFLGR